MTELEERVNRFEAIQPLDPFTFSASHPERSAPGFDVYQKPKLDYDKLQFDAYNELMTSQD